MGRGRIILPAVDPNDIDIEDLKPGQVALFGDSTKNGNLTMKRKDGTTEDLAEKGEGGADLTEVFENADVTKIDSFSEVVEYVNSSTEENFNTVYPKWVDYSVLDFTSNAVSSNGIDGTYYFIQFELNPQIRMNSEQILSKSSIVQPSIYRLTESEANPGYIESIIFEGNVFSDYEAAGQTLLEQEQGNVARRQYDIYTGIGLTDMKNLYLNFYGVAGAIKVLNFINPDVEKDKILAELQAIVDACDPQIEDLDNQIQVLNATEAEAVATYAALKKSLDSAAKAKDAEIAAAVEAGADKATVEALTAELEAIKTQAKIAAETRAAENNQFNIDKQDLTVQIERLQKECTNAKEQLRELSEDLKTVSDTVRIKIDENNRIILPRIEYLYLTDSAGNRIRKVSDASEKYASIILEPSSGVANTYSLVPTDGSSDSNNSSNYITIGDGPFVTKDNFTAGIYIISVLDRGSKAVIQQKKILSFDTK